MGVQVFRHPHTPKSLQWQQLEQPLSCRFMCRRRLCWVSYQVSCLLPHRAGDASLQRQWVASSFRDITPHCPLALGNIIVEFPSGIWHPREQISGKYQREDFQQVPWVQRPRDIPVTGMPAPTRSRSQPGGGVCLGCCLF